MASKTEGLPPPGFILHPESRFSTGEGVFAHLSSQTPLVCKHTLNAERAVQAVQDALRTFLEGRKQSSVTALPLALWGLNDLLGPVSPFSPHRLVFGRDAVGFGDAAPYTDADGCEDAGAFFKRLVQGRETVRTKLQAAHDRAYSKFLDKYPEQVFSPGERVWVRNRVESPPLYPKWDRLWQGPAEVLARVSRSTYRVCCNGVD